MDGVVYASGRNHQRSSERGLSPDRVGSALEVDVVEAVLVMVSVAASASWSVSEWALFGVERQGGDGEHALQEIIEINKYEYQWRL